jgi:anti-anti-sigma factor
MTDDDAAPQGRFEFVPADDRESAVVRAAGDIDLTNVGRFQAALDTAVAAAAAFIVDLTAVTYADSATIRALISAARQARLTIQVGTTGSVTETLLTVSGLDQVASVVSTCTPRLTTRNSWISSARLRSSRSATDSGRASDAGAGSFPAPVLPAAAASPAGPITGTSFGQRFGLVRRLRTDRAQRVVKQRRERVRVPGEQVGHHGHEVVVAERPDPGNPELGGRLA